MKEVGPALGGPPWDPWSMSLNAPHHKEKEYIWFMGGGRNGFQDIKHFMKRAGGACPRGTQRSMSLNVAYHKEQQYIWFVGGDLNGFRYITHFMKWRGWGMPPGDPFRIHGPCHLMRLIIRNKNMYDLWVGIWTVSDIKRFVKMGLGMPPGDTQGSQDPCHWMRLKKQEYMVYGWGSERFPRYNTWNEEDRACPRGTPLRSTVHVIKCASS